MVRQAERRSGVEFMLCGKNTEGPGEKRTWKAPKPKFPISDSDDSIMFKACNRLRASWKI